jgi:hypothetical protein
MDAAEIFKALSAPFPPEKVSWRVGSTNKEKTKAMALAYIDARDVMDRLDTVVTPAAWSRKHPHVGPTTTCALAILIDGEWVTKEDGAGATDVEAEKGSLSDSLKRAAVNWGIGRYLYDLASPWVEIEPMGRSYRIKDSEKPKLLALLTRHAGGGPVAAPRQPAPPKPPEQSAAVLAAGVAISLCKTQAALDKWKVDNKDMLDSLPNDEYNAIVTLWKARVVELRPKAVSA